MASSAKTPIWKVILLLIPVGLMVVTLGVLVAGIVKYAMGGGRGGKSFDAGAELHAPAVADLDASTETEPDAGTVAPAPEPQVAPPAPPPSKKPATKPATKRPGQRNQKR